MATINGGANSVVYEKCENDGTHVDAGWTYLVAGAASQQIGPTDLPAVYTSGNITMTVTATKPTLSYANGQRVSAWVSCMQCWLLAIRGL